MKVFFKGWRRKVGCLTLMMATVLMAGWIGSLQISSGLVIQSFSMTPNTSTSHVLISSSGSLRWMRHSCRFPNSDTVTHLQWPLGQAVDHPFTSERIAWQQRFRWNGFEFGEGEVMGFPLTSWKMPYWSVTSFLTLLSAYWMLIPLRRRTPTEGQLCAVTGIKECSRQATEA